MRAPIVHCFLSFFVLAALAVAGCDSGLFATSSSPRESFDWAGATISFSPPPSGWRREGNTSGGIKGLRFVKERSVGEAIGVGDYYKLSDRLRRDVLQRMIDDFEAFDRRRFDDALRHAYAHTEPTYTSQEAEVGKEINAALGRARVAYHAGEREEARTQLGAALIAAERLRFALDDVIGAVEFAPESRQEPLRWLVLNRNQTTISGEPAVVVDYTFDGPDRKLYGREVYVVHDSHLYIATFLGLQKTLPEFERVVESIQFPR